MSVLAVKDKWFLFINCPETHYPYDWGEGIEEEIQLRAFPALKQALNLRSLVAPPKVGEELEPYSLKLHEMQKRGVEVMDQKIGGLFLKLKEISSRQVYIVVCGDHGENFGEIGTTGVPLYGHMHPSEECLTVPLCMGIL